MNLSQTQNPLPSSQHSSHCASEDDLHDDISDLTFDRSAFDTSIYTQSPLQRDLEQQQAHQQQSQQEVELSERNVRRYGARKGYAPALVEDSEGESDTSASSSHSGCYDRVPRRRHQRRAPLSRKELMIRDFSRRVEEASEFDSRFYNMSTLIILGQVAVMALMIRQGGILPIAENIMLGPSVYTMLDFGAQQGGFIIYENQWWRLVTAMFVHAGIIHLACNVYVQWQICGFLSALWGRFSWLLIFFASGIFGNVYSVIHSPDVVGVGSSGGLMGVLAAWAVFIVITWKLVPEEHRPDRNKQLCSLVVNIAIVIVIGQLEFVDGHAHLGGMIQGSLLALFLLSDEHESINMKWVMRTFSLGGIVVLWIWAVAIAWRDVEPSEEVLLQYE